MAFPEVLLLCSDPIAGSGESSRNFAPMALEMWGWLAPGPLLFPRKWILELGVGNGGAPRVVLQRSRRSVTAGNYGAPTPGVKTGEGEIPGKQNKGKDESPEKSRLSLSEAAWMEGKFRSEKFC